MRLSKLFLILGLIILFIHHIYGKTFCQFYFRIVVALFSLKFCRSFNPTNLLIHILPHAISSQTPPPQKEFNSIAEFVIFLLYHITLRCVHVKSQHGASCTRVCLLLANYVIHDRGMHGKSSLSA